MNEFAKTEKIGQTYGKSREKGNRKRSSNALEKFKN